MMLLQPLLQRIFHCSNHLLLLLAKCTDGAQDVLPDSKQEEDLLLGFRG